MQSTKELPQNKARPLRSLAQKYVDPWWNLPQNQFYVLYLLHSLIAYFKACMCGDDCKDHCNQNQNHKGRDKSIWWALW
jgi:hypothetical protein